MPAALPSTTARTSVLLRLPSSTSQASMPAPKLKAVPKNAPPKAKQADGAAENGANSVCKPLKRSASPDMLAGGRPAKAPRQATVTGHAAAAPLLRSPSAEVAEYPVSFFKFDAAAHLIRCKVIKGPNVLARLQKVFDKCDFPLDVGFLKLPATSQQTIGYECVVSSGGEILGIASARSKKEAKCLVFQEVWDMLASFSSCSNGECAAATGDTDAPTVRIRRKKRGKRKNPPKNLVRRAGKINRGGQGQGTHAVVQDFTSSTSSVTATEYAASLTRELVSGEATKVFAVHSLFEKTLAPKQADTRAAANIEQRKITGAAVKRKRKSRRSKNGKGTPKKFRKEIKRLNQKFSGLMVSRNSAVQKRTNVKAISVFSLPLAFRYNIESLTVAGRTFSFFKL